MIRDASKTPKKANKAEILFSLKASRDVFFTPRLLQNGDTTHMNTAGTHVCISGSYCLRCKKYTPDVYYASSMTKREST